MLHSKRVALRVIERDGDQEQNRQDRDSHNRVAQHFALMSFCFTGLGHQGTLDGLSHVGVLNACGHWHLGALLSCHLMIVSLINRRFKDMAGCSPLITGSTEVTDPAVTA